MLQILVLASIEFLISARGLPAFNSQSHLYELFGGRDSAACDLEKLRSCGEVFFKEVGYGRRSQFSSICHVYLPTIYRSRSEGIRPILISIYDAKNCYGDGLMSCITPDNLQSLGLEKQTATSYTVYFHQNAYDCGPGKAVIDNNFDCIQKARADPKTAAHGRECGETFRKEVQKDPGNYCKYTSEYAQCGAQPYKFCGQDVGSEVCDAKAFALESLIPSCKVTCSKN